MNDGVLRTKIRRMLEAHGTATLATAGPGGPWAAAVFYASDEQLNLYFVSDGGTRHATDMLAHGRVAAAIHADVDNWSDVRGLQVEGDAQPVPDAQRVAALDIYLRKFPDVRRLRDAPRDENERLIGQRLARIALWRLSPRRIRIIDNRESFGWKQELVL